MRSSTTVNNITNGGGIKYFHADSALADFSASGGESIAVGGAASATNSNTIAIGTNSKAAVGNSIAIGNNAKTVVSGGQWTGSIALGNGATAYGENAISSGANTALGAGSVAGTSVRPSTPTAPSRRRPTPCRVRRPMTSAPR